MVLYGNPSGFVPMIITLPSWETILADALRWEDMDAFTPENIEDINAEYYEEEKREREFKERMERSREEMRKGQEELFASVGLRPDGRPTLASMMEQARCIGYARGIGRGLGQEETEEDREEDRRLHEHWRYGVYGKKGLKDRQAELLEEERFKFHIKLQPIGPIKETDKDERAY